MDTHEMKRFAALGTIVTAIAAISWSWANYDSKPAEAQKSGQTTCVAYNSGLKYCLEDSKGEAWGFKEFGHTGELRRCFYAPGHQEYCLRSGTGEGVAASAETIKAFQDTLKPAHDLQARINQDLKDSM